jgi:FXSXX-COOH protein
MADEAGDQGSGIIDLSGIDLATLAELPDTVLAGALREILSEPGGDRYCGFESALP